MPPRIAERFQSRRDVDAVARRVAAVDHDVAQVDADPILDALVREAPRHSRAVISRWMWTAARSAGERAVELGHQARRRPILTMRPPCETTAGSTTSSRIVRSRAKVPVSSRSISRV